MNHQIFILDLHQQAESYLAQEKLHEAQIICNKIIEIQSEFAPAYNTLGKVLQTIGKLDLAKEYYQKAIVINSHLPEAHFNLANLSAQEQQWQAAIDSYNRAIQLNPNQAETYHKLGEVLLQLKKWEKASNAYRKAIEINPTFSWSYHKLGEALLQLKKWEEAINTYQKAIEINPTFPWSYHKLGEGLIQLKQWEDVVIAYRHFIKLKPDFYLAHKNLGDALIQLERWSEVIEIYQRAIKIDPNIGLAHKNLGDALVKLERWSEAVEAYRHLTKINPKSYVHYNQLAGALVRLGEVDKTRQFDTYTEATACYQTLIKLQPNQRENYHKLADIFQKIGEFDAAVDTYLQVIELKPDVPWSYNHLGELLIKLKKWNEAIFTFLTALSIEPNMPWIYQALGEALAEISQSNLENKINYYCCAIQNDRAEVINSKLVLHLPRNSDLYLYLGNALTKKEKYKGAVIIYNMALQLKVNDQEITNQLQKTLEKKVELEQEVERCRRAVKQNPKSSKHYYDLGIALTRQEEWEQASLAFLKAIQLKPETNWSYSRFWNYLKQSDKLEEVVSFYHRIIQKKPDSILSHLNLGEVLTEQGKVDAAIVSYRTACYQQTLKSHPNFVKKYWHQEQVRNPNFIIIGTGKSGTTSLYNYLAQHPQILPAIKKEIYFWSRHFDRGIDWYLAHFPPIPEGNFFLTGEATPSYINSWDTPSRLFSIFPKIKLIVILRNPVDRAVSHYYHEVRLKMEYKSLPEAINSQLEKLQKMSKSALEEAYWSHISYYITYGLYVEFLKKWMTIFPREQFLILRSEDFYTNSATTMQQVFNFLDLPEYQIPHYQKLNSGSYPEITKSIHSSLSDYFRPYNQRLEEYLGMKFNWN